jgi:hypothetical protein
MAVRREMSLAHPAHVFRDADDAVRVVALEIGLDQVIGDDLSLHLRGARRREDARGEIAQPPGIDAKVLFHRPRLALAARFTEDHGSCRR